MRYEYVARNEAGRVIKGILDAYDESSARAKLRSMGVYVTSLSKPGKWDFLFRGKKVKPFDIAILSEQLASMINAGISVVKSLNVLGQQVDNPNLRRIVHEIEEDVSHGTFFADSIAKHPNIFSKVFVNLVRVGELGGVLDEMLLRLSSYLNKEMEIRQKVRTALTYPAVILSFAVIAISFLVVFVIPRFAAIYTKLGITLPLATLILVRVGELVKHYWWALLLFFGVASIAFKYVTSTAVGQISFDKLKLRMPIFGELIKKSTVSRFLRVFAALVNSGVPVMEALDVVDNISNNKVLTRALERLKDNVNRGGDISTPLSESGIFPAAALQMIAAGEESGELGKMLNKSSDFLDRDVEHTTKKLITALGPALTFGLAIAIGLVIMAIYLPMFDLIGKMSNQ